jgi:hypothetical protein
MSHKHLASNARHFLEVGVSQISHANTAIVACAERS